MNKISPVTDYALRRTSVSEVRALIDAGHMAPKDPFELIDGALVEMPSEGFDHGDLKNVIAAWLYGQLDLNRYRIFVDTTLYLDGFNAPDPDIYVFPAGIHMRDLKPSDVALVIEIAGSSLKKDRELKAPLYEQFGIGEYWLIALETGQVEQFVRLDGGRYTDARLHTASDRVTCQSIAGLVLQLDALNI